MRGVSGLAVISQDATGQPKKPRVILPDDRTDGEVVFHNSSEYAQAFEWRTQPQVEDHTLAHRWARRKQCCALWQNGLPIDRFGSRLCENPEVAQNAEK